MSDKTFNIKKAIDYAERLKPYVVKDEISLKLSEEMAKVINEMFMEMKGIIAQRNLTQDSGIYSIIIEQDKKWKSVCRKANINNMDNIFMDSLFKLVPEMKMVVDDGKRIIQERKRGAF